MEAGVKDENEIGRSNCTDNLDHGSSGVSRVWQLGDANHANAIGLFPSESLLPVCSTSSAPAPMVDSFGQTLWHDPTNIQNPGFSGYSSSRTGIGNINHASLRDSMDRPLDMMWNPPDLLPKGNGLFPPNVPVFLPQSLSEFPADSGFIERAARFSCFGGGNLSDMMNHSLGVPESMGLYSQGGRVMRGSHGIYGGNVVKSAFGEKPATKGANVNEPPKDPLFGAEHGGRFKNDGKSGNFLRSNEECKLNIPGSSNVSDEARSSGGNDQDEQPCQEDKGRETPSKGSNTKKRKRMGQDLEPDHSSRPEKSDEAADDNTDNKKKEEPNSNSAGKQAKQNSDPPKDGYIHVRARRGQATNSHSLAERVRREKISERMKFLQDLVPGCNKVTGKAVMLDEIINYVQSLQRQVEFLSMKLATVNPRLDFNIEELLAKEALHTRAGPSSCVPFPQDMPMVYPNLLHQSPSGLVIQPVSNPSNFFPRAINPQFPPVNGGFKPQENHVWEGDLHNVIQMSCGTSVPTDNQDETESQSGGNMKVEP